MPTQLLLHLVGDYLTQSHWMAVNKTRSSFAALCHALAYTLPFLLIAGWGAVLVIGVSHFLVDRFRLARFVVFAKNHLGWPWPKWSDCSATGYPSDTMLWLAVWLLTIADNTIHLLCNAAAIAFLGAYRP